MKNYFSNSRLYLAIISSLIVSSCGLNNKSNIIEEFKTYKAKLDYHISKLDKNLKKLEEDGYKDIGECISKDLQEAKKCIDKIEGHVNNDEEKEKCENEIINYERKLIDLKSKIEEENLNINLENKTINLNDNVASKDRYELTQKCLNYIWHWKEFSSSKNILEKGETQTQSEITTTKQKLESLRKDSYKHVFNNRILNKKILKIKDHIEKNQNLLMQIKKYEEEKNKKESNDEKLIEKSKDELEELSKDIIKILTKKMKKIIKKETKKRGIIKKQINGRLNKLIRSNEKINEIQEKIKSNMDILIITLYKLINTNQNEKTINLFKKISRELFDTNKESDLQFTPNELETYFYDSINKFLKELGAEEKYEILNKMISYKKILMNRFPLSNEERKCRLKKFKNLSDIEYYDAERPIASNRHIPLFIFRFLDKQKINYEYSYSTEDKGATIEDLISETKTFINQTLKNTSDIFKDILEEEENEEGSEEESEEENEEKYEELKYTDIIASDIIYNTCENILDDTNKVLQKIKTNEVSFRTYRYSEKEIIEKMNEYFLKDQYINKLYIELTNLFEEIEISVEKNKNEIISSIKQIITKLIKINFYATTIPGYYLIYDKQNIYEKNVYEKKDRFNKIKSSKEFILNSPAIIFKQGDTLKTILKAKIRLYSELKL
ncbi:MAG: hypothetical protein GY830_04400 [Bacteroidetes bacterium]|nr:hypothetical protein [Bacteroidota bacterium]